MLSSSAITARYSLSKKTVKLKGRYSIISVDIEIFDESRTSTIAICNANDSFFDEFKVMISHDNCQG